MIALDLIRNIALLISLSVLFELLIRDRGKGIPPERNPDDPGTLGLRLIQVLASQARAGVSIVSSGGTEVRIVLEDVPSW